MAINAGTKPAVKQTVKNDPTPLTPAVITVGDEDDTTPSTAPAPATAADTTGTTDTTNDTANSEPTASAPAPATTVDTEKKVEKAKTGVLSLSKLSTFVYGQLVFAQGKDYKVGAKLRPALLKEVAPSGELVFLEQSCGIDGADVVDYTEESVPFGAPETTAKRATDADIVVTHTAPAPKKVDDGVDEDGETGTITV